MGKYYIFEENMGHCFGQRARTRDLFSRPFRKHGITSMNKVMLSYRKGDYVDVIADGSVQKGMSFKFYHGKTGIIFDVTKHSVGVVVNKRVGGRIIPKRLHVRVEHVRMSRSRTAFVDRVHANDEIKREFKKNGTFVQCKRIPAQPRAAHVVAITDAGVEYVNPIKFRELY